MDEDAIQSSKPPLLSTSFSKDIKGTNAQRVDTVVLNPHAPYEREKPPFRRTNAPTASSSAPIHSNVGLTTPSLESILESYALEGAGDRELLIAILTAKAKEDERMAAVDNIRVELLRKENLERDRFSHTVHARQPSTSKSTQSHPPQAIPVSRAQSISSVAPAPSIRDHHTPDSLYRAKAPTDLPKPSTDISRKRRATSPVFQYYNPPPGSRSADHHHHTTTTSPLPHVPSMQHPPENTGYTIYSHHSTHRAARSPVTSTTTLPPMRSVLPSHITSSTRTKLASPSMLLSAHRALHAHGMDPEENRERVSDCRSSGRGTPPQSFPNPPTTVHLQPARSPKRQRANSDTSRTHTASRSPSPSQSTPATSEPRTSLHSNSDGRSIAGGAGSTAATGSQL